MSSLEEKKFLQLIKFSFDLSVKVTRCFTETNVLHRYNNSFVDFLYANKHKIYHLWINNTRCCVCTSNALLKPNRDLNKEQFTKLFDLNGNATVGHFRKGPGKSIVQYCVCGINCLVSCSLDDLDVILIHTLLRNFVKLNPDDEMWLYTVRKIRNHLAHAVSTTCFDNGRLEKWWSKLEGSVLGLASKIPPKHYADLVKDQIKLLGIADFNINDEEIKNLIKTENKKLYDKIINEHENKFQQIMDKQDIHAKDTKEKSETDKTEIIKHIKQTTDDLSIEIRKLTFKCTLHNVETEVKSEMMETTPYKTEAKQTIIKQEPSANPSSEDQNVQPVQTITKCKQEPSESPNEQYSDRCKVEWKLKTPDTWRVEQIKQTLENVSGMLQQWFHIEFIYVGSLVIHTSVPRYVLRDRQVLKLAIQSFLEKIVEVCDINTDVAETVNVDFRVLDVISSTEAVKSKVERMTKFPLYSERTLVEDNRRKIQTMTDMDVSLSKVIETTEPLELGEPPYTMLRLPGDGDGVQIIPPKEHEAEHRQDMATSKFELPVVDLSKVKSNRKELAQHVVDALETIGFICIENIEGLDYKRLHKCCKWFFGLPIEKKEKLLRKTWNPENAHLYRGYFPFGYKPPSRIEGFEFGRDIDPNDPTVDPRNWFYEPSVWPEEDGDLFFKQFLLETYEYMHHTAMEILRLVAIGLGIDEHAFEPLFSDKPVSTFRMVHYPPWHDNPPKDVITEDGKVLTTYDHTDSSFITLRTTFDYRGLEVLTPDGKWVGIEPRPNSLVMNIGDVFSRMMNGRFKAIRHRVIDIGVDRYSVPFFLEPAYDGDIGLHFMSKFLNEEGSEHIVEKYGTWVINRMKHEKKYPEYIDLPEF